MERPLTPDETDEADVITSADMGAGADAADQTAGADMDALPDVPDIAFREPGPADHPRLARLVREWWDERPPQVERLWFVHFRRTSVLATTAGGRPAAIGIGFLSAADPARGVIHLVAVAPVARRRGVGRTIGAAVEARLAAAGATIVEAVIWPGNRGGIRFLEALGYHTTTSAAGADGDAVPLPRLYGVPAIADYDGPGEDRAIFERDLSRADAGVSRRAVP